MSVAILRASDVWLDYDGGVRATRALRGITLSVSPGEFVGIMGPSGSGKSSLLHVAAGLRRPSRGDVLFDGRPWTFPIGRGAERRRKSLGLIFQEPFLIPHWTVEENIRVHRSPGGGDRVERIAADLGIDHLLDEFPDRISLGERQRASVARALIHDPILVLADEPTSCLDTENGRNVMQALVRCQGRAALVVCSHDRRMLSGADRIDYLEDGAIVPTPSGEGGTP